MLGATVVVFLLYQQGRTVAPGPAAVLPLPQRLLSFPGKFNQIADVTAQSMLDLNSREDASLAVLAAPDSHPAGQFMPRAQLALDTAAAVGTRPTRSPAAP